MSRRSFRRLAFSVTVVAILATLLPGVAVARGFAARASLTPRLQYVGDSVGTTFSLTVKNTGTVRTIGSVQISRPTAFWAVTACPAAPAGWTAIKKSASCQFRSQPGQADDIARGQSAHFDFVATTAPSLANRNGTWTVAVSKNSDFSDPSWITQAASMAPGLATTAYSFEVTDAVLAASPATVGDPCPASNQVGAAGATGQIIVICGTNHTNSTQTPKQAYSSLDGTFLTAHGGFGSRPVAAGAANVVLGNWFNVALASVGSGYTVRARVGAFSGRISPRVTFLGYSTSNTAPVANNDPGYSVDEDGSLVAVSVLSNDSDANGDSLTAGLDTGPTHAAVFNLNSDGTFSYSPSANFHGTDTFTYNANDGTLDSNVATVTITVNPVNDDPVAVNDSYNGTEDTQLLVTVGSGVLGNDADIDADPLTAVKVTDPTYGDLTLGSDGSFTYDPYIDTCGSDSFTYKANDGTADSGIATVNLNITCANDAPVATDDTMDVTQDTTATVAAPGVLANATDGDSPTLTALLVSGPSHAQSFTLNANGSVSYQPISGYTGTDSFTWKANDGSLDSNDATVTITVNATGGGGGGTGGGGGCLKAC
jgi:VCBS repeat-containing protein